MSNNNNNILEQLQALLEGNREMMREFEIIKAHVRELLAENKRLKEENHQLKKFI